MYHADSSPAEIAAEIARIASDIAHVASDIAPELDALVRRVLATSDSALMTTAVRRLAARADGAALDAMERGDPPDVHLAFACSKELAVLDRILVVSGA